MNNMALTETLKNIAKIVLPQSLEEKFGLTKKSPVFNIPISEETKKSLLEKTPKLETIGLPFTTKEWLIPKTGIEKFAQEWITPFFLKPYTEKVQSKIDYLVQKGIESQKAERIIIKRELEKQGKVKQELGWLNKELTPEQISGLQKHEMFSGTMTGLDILAFLPMGKLGKFQKPIKKGVENLAPKIMKAGEKIISELPKAPTPPDQVIKAFNETKKIVEKAVIISGERINELATKHQKINTLVADMFRKGIVNVDDIPQFKNWGFANDEAAEFIERFATFGGKDLNRISQWQKKLAAVLPGETLKLMGKEPSGFVNTLFHKIPLSIVNAWRAALTSQLATAMRNAEVASSVFSFRIIEDAMIGATKAVTGKAPARRAFAPMIADMTAVLNRIKPAERKLIAELLEVNPLAKYKLYATPINDVVMADKVSKVMTVFNRTQEFAIRNLVFDGVLRGELGKVGIDLAKTPLKQIPQKAILKAVDEALRITFASPAKGFMGEMVRLWNKVPIMPVLTYPFMRFLSNSLRAIYEFTPLGITKFLNPKTIKALLKGDEVAMRSAARVFIGANMQMLAIALRNSEHAGDKWYEVKVGGKTIDTRPWGPIFPTYLFIAEALKGNWEKIGVKDVVEGLTGIRRLAGSGLFMIDLLGGEESWEGLKKSLTRIGQDFIGGFGNFWGFKTFKDFVAEFNQDEAIVRYVKGQPIWARLQSKIPWLSQKLPEYPDITQAKPYMEEMPSIKQLTGLSLREKKNFLGKEMDRLNITTTQVWPKTGYPEIDRLIAEKTGYLMERASEVLEKSEKYQKADDYDKEQTIKEFFSQAKKEVKAFILDIQKEKIAQEFADETESFETKEERKKFLNGLKQKGLLTEDIMRLMIQLKTQ